MGKTDSRLAIPAIKVSQWLDQWEQVQYDANLHRRKPEQHFYMFSLSANVLKRLSGIYRRSLTTTRRTLDLGIQRRHDLKHSKRINQFVQFGYPWSERWIMKLAGWRKPVKRLWISSLADAAIKEGFAKLKPGPS